MSKLDVRAHVAQREFPLFDRLAKVSDKLEVFAVFTSNQLLADMDS